MKRVVSYSLYGNIEKYTLGAIRNAEDLPVYYPGWEGWFYVGKTVPKDIIDKLNLLGMKVILMKEDECPASTMWRFLVFAEKDVEYAIIRDTDSRLSNREAVAVKEWIDSGKNFHIMRDHPSHDMVMLAGMWGARAEKLRDIKKLINDWRGEKIHTGDQLFLKENIYPLAYVDSFVHASFNAYEPQAVSFSTERSEYYFVGEVFDENEYRNKNDLKSLKVGSYGKVRKLFFYLMQMLSRKNRKKTNRTGEINVIHVSASLFRVSAASRLIIALRMRGVDAIALVKKQVQINLPFPCYDNILTVSQKVVFVYARLVDIFFRFKFMILGTFFSECKSDSPWNDGVLGEPIHNFVNKIEPDIVHLHWIASGFPAIKYLHKIKKPIVWTFHDVWPVTAGHHCDMECDECKRDGKNCKQFRKSASRFSSSESLWKYKKDYYSKINDLTIITPSNWLGNIAKKSPLFRGRKVFVIPNCIDTELFCPLEKKTARNALGLPLDKKIILFSASGGIDIKYKGFDLLVDALKTLKEKLKLEDIHLVVIGSSGGNEMPLPFPVTFLGQIDSELMLPGIYNSADVFVGPSRQDNFPNVFIESLSCGVPGVGFDVGGIPEIIAHKDNGYIAKSFDTDDLANGILWVLSDEIRYGILSKRARKFVEENLSFSVISEKHCQIYRQIISDSKK